MLTKTRKSPSKRNAEEQFTFRYLESSEYSDWDGLVDVSPQGSVFCRSWWLNAVGDVRVLACFSGRELIAGIPLYFEKHFGIPVCTMPKLTQTWGVVMQPLGGNAVAAAARQARILKAFAIELARYKLFFQAFHPSLSNWLPFYWSGFRQTTRFTYVFEDAADLSRVWDEMPDTAQRQIRKAQRAGLTVVPCDITEVYRLEGMSYRRRGSRLPHTDSMLKSIYYAAKAHHSSACFAVVDQDKIVYAASMLVWDNKRAYGLVCGVDEALKTSGANSLQVWHTIQFAAQRSRVFDFTGSMVEGIERFNRHFGAKQVPYNYIMKAPPLFNCYLQLTGKL